MNGSSTNGSSESVVGSIAGFGNDVANLAELQLRLAALDFKESAGRARLPLVLVGAGLVILLGSVPVAIGGLALLVAERFSISSLESFRRSRDELVRNVSWIRTVLVHSGRPVPKQR